MDNERQRKECFVVMPIRSPGTDEHAHFSSVFVQGIKMVMGTELGYNCIRADDVSESGSINNDVITRIATCDVLIADLTDLNPNVFYEIGVRHALRGIGTILILDENRTSNIPFDLSSYRTIKYRGTLTGIGNLRSNIELFVRNIEAKPGGKRDSPVHDTFPFLPENVVESQHKSTEGKLRTQLTQANQRITQLESKLGISGTFEKTETSNPIDRLQHFRSQADMMGLPKQIHDECALHSQGRRIREFVDAVFRLCSTQQGHSPEIFTSVASMASQLGLDEIAVAIYDLASGIFPQNAGLVENRISHTLTCENAGYRERVRRELRQSWGVTLLEDESYIVPKSFPPRQIFLAARYCDSLRQENRMVEIHNFVEGLVGIFNDDPVVLRSYAAALRDVLKKDQALSFYKKSFVVGTPKTRYVTAHWWAIDLENEGMIKQAIQIQARGCLSYLDYSDAWGNLVSAIANAEKYNLPEMIDLLQGFGRDDLVEIARCCLSCSAISAKSVRYISAALGVSEQDVFGLRGEFVPFSQRKACAEKVLRVFGDDYFDLCVSA